MHREEVSVSIRSSEQDLVIWEGFPEELGLEMIALEGEREWERKIEQKELHVKRPRGGNLGTSGCIQATSQVFSSGNLGPLWTPAAGNSAG